MIGFAINYINILILFIVPIYIFKEFMKNYWLSVSPFFETDFKIFFIES